MTKKSIGKQDDAVAEPSRKIVQVPENTTQQVTQQSRLSGQELREAVIARVAARQSQTEVAQALNIHKSTVSRIIASATKADVTGQSPLSRDWRENQAALAIRVVDKALSDESEDLLKRAGIAQTALKGLGYYSNDQAAVKLEAHFHSVGAKQIAALDAELFGELAPDKAELDGKTACGQDAQTGETEES